MEEAPTNGAFTVTLCDKHVENGLYPKSFRGLIASADLKITYDVVVCHVIKEPENSLVQAVDACELVDVIKVINGLQHGQEIHRAGTLGSERSDSRRL